MFRIICLFIGYALGHLQTSYIIGKLIKKIDIREHGSGNAGMSNSLRVMGKKFAIPILVVDLLKSLGAFAICAAIYEGSGSFFTFGDGNAGVIPGIYGSLGAILGHVFPVYMRFKGGKGMACSVGMSLALNIQMTGIILAVAALTILITRYIISASIAALIFLPVALAMHNFEIEVLYIGYFITVLLMYKHKSNILRLLNGTENKMGPDAKSS